MPLVDAESKQKRVEWVYGQLERHPNGLTEGEVAELARFGRRSVNSYLRELEAQGKVYKDGLLWFALPYERTRLRRLVLSPEEAMTLYLAARLLVKQHDKRNESAEVALAKLAEALTGDAGVGDEVYQAALELARRPGDDAYSRVYRTMMQGYIYRRRVALTYAPMRGRPFETQFAPYLLEPSPIGYATYAIGHSSIVDDLRTYKLERIEAAALTRERYDIPASFPGLEYLRDAWSIISGEELVTVELRFSPRVTRRVRESRWHPSQQVREDPDHPGGCIWTAQIADLTDFRPWVRSWGADVEVLAPEELRNSLSREAQRMAGLYNVAALASETMDARVLRCWGKVLRGSTEFHPALFHMLDVGHVAQALLRPQSSPRWRRILASALGATPEMLVAWLPYVIAMHDIGKISAAFQSMIETQKQRLQSEGFSFTGWRSSLDLHHSRIGQAYVREHTMPCALPEPLHSAWTDMVGGHHGQFPPPAALRRTRAQIQLYEPQMWRDLRDAAERIIREQLLPSSLYTLPEPHNIATATMALTGFAILCDWLGSDGRFFQPVSDVTIGDYIQRSRDHAQQAVEATGFCRPVQSGVPGAFATLFADKDPPRPLQAAVDAIPEEHLQEPCLIIIEAPTGEGKTEAALALAHRLAAIHGTDELYYALPTTATSNQMFGRIREHLRERLALPTQVRLIHGQAFLVEDDLRIEPLDNAQQADEQAMVEWFTSKKRALLSPFGVGTIDQAELAGLNVKHSALRLLGLAGKVLVLDEVHAYDTYMTTIVETLLSWLAELGTSVILLSATLPQAQRMRLACAYGVPDPDTLQDRDGYPSLTVLSNKGGTYHTEPAPYQPDREIRVQPLHLHDDDPRAKAEWLLEAVADGGCACWITNTVDRAQRLFAALQEAEEDIDLMLLHARFPLEDRQELEEEITERFGPGHTGTVRKRGIVIGTQVLEQSLDLDFDVMVSDLAPIDLLLQRAGRLQRHERVRASAYSGQRTLWINVQGADGDGLELGVDALIYDEFLLRQTWCALADRAMLCLPADYRALVEAVYGCTDVQPPSPLSEAWSDLQKKRSYAEKEAELRLIPKPDPEPSFCAQMARLVFEEDETGAGWIVAQTRLGRESINLIPLERAGELACIYPTREAVSLHERASDEAQLRLLRRHLRVSRPEIVHALKEAPLPELFNSARLRGYHALWLEGGQAHFPLKDGTLVVTLDPYLGLLIHKEKGV